MLGNSLLLMVGVVAASPPAPLPPVPTPQQLAWQRCELIMFLHFGVNTFTDREWGDGTEDPAIFQPKALDARQWVRVAKDAGFKMMILTAKHHDGFCLWPSQYTEHSVKNSPWRDGQGDVVQEFVAACREMDMKVGFYLSPWDRHEKSYGDSPVYNEYFRNQLTELLTRYGDVAEMWFDGACGEGSNGKKQVYDWESYYKVVRDKQPNAVIAICGPDVRWVGNESGVAREMEWSVRPVDDNGMPVPEPTTWHPAECDVSIRPGWFWHAKEDAQVKPLDHLLDIYFSSVGRNSLLLLNVPPNDQGLLPDADVKRLQEFRQALDEIFRENLALGQKVQANGKRGRMDDFGPDKALDGEEGTYWSLDDDQTEGWIEVDLGQPMTFSVSKMEEHIALGQRVMRYRIEVKEKGSWRTVVEGTTVGYRKLDRFPKITARHVRWSILESRGCPTICGLGLYRGR